MDSDTLSFVKTAVLAGAKAMGAKVLKDGAVLAWTKLRDAVDSWAGTSKDAIADSIEAVGKAPDKKGPQGDLEDALDGVGAAPSRELVALARDLVAALRECQESSQILQQVENVQNSAVAQSVYGNATATSTTEKKTS